LWVDLWVEFPNVNSSQTWQDGLYEIRLDLKYYRPKESNENRD